ncbi:uncharacterized protein I303_105112 [Kwoniella dejecticola CBS 10117]|uniref:Uncharacterized protein n=1 Tax=Kwoniella dejecticola CBS 10117 TaxID=1296121 RepID=A0A1A6A3G2_9TREE|nr:uncharacterized protein I303_05443 [Kwoniella dejecticola CBS 10117]OBR84584.1 hypothetical protein I303_05443 [Kwoniella dejecticola CBS 10117]
MAESQSLQLTVSRISLGDNNAPAVGPSSIIEVRSHDKLDTIFHQIHTELQISIPLEQIEWMQFPLIDPQPVEDSQSGSGSVRPPATLHGQETPRSLEWSNGVKIYYKKKEDRVDYTRSPEKALG